MRPEIWAVGPESSATPQKTQIMALPCENWTLMVGEGGGWANITISMAICLPFYGELLFT